MKMRWIRSSEGLDEVAAHAAVAAADTRSTFGTAFESSRVRGCLASLASETNPRIFARSQWLNAWW
jgi:hypothetical protein